MNAPLLISKEPRQTKVNQIDEAMVLDFGSWPFALAPTVAGAISIDRTQGLERLFVQEAAVRESMMAICSASVRQSKVALGAAR